MASSDEMDSDNEISQEDDQMIDQLLSSLPETKIKEDKLARQTRQCKKGSTLAKDKDDNSSMSTGLRRSSRKRAMASESPKSGSSIKPKHRKNCACHLCRKVTTGQPPAKKMKETTQADEKMAMVIESKTNPQQLLSEDNPRAQIPESPNLKIFKKVSTSSVRDTFPASSSPFETAGPSTSAKVSVNVPTQSNKPIELKSRQSSDQNVGQHVSATPNLMEMDSDKKEIQQIKQLPLQLTEKKIEADKLARQTRQCKKSSTLAKDKDDNSSMSTGLRRSLRKRATASESPKSGSSSKHRKNCACHLCRKVSKNEYPAEAMKITAKLEEHLAVIRNTKSFLQNQRTLGGIARAKKWKDMLNIPESASGQLSSKVSAIECNLSNESKSCNKPKHPINCSCHLRQKVSKNAPQLSEDNPRAQTPESSNLKIFKKAAILSDGDTFPAFLSPFEAAGPSTSAEVSVNVPTQSGKPTELKSCQFSDHNVGQQMEMDSDEEEIQQLKQIPLQLTEKEIEENKLAHQMLQLTRGSTLTEDEEDDIPSKSTSQSSSRKSITESNFPESSSCSKPKHPINCSCHLRQKASENEHLAEAMKITKLEEHLAVLKNTKTFFPNQRTLEGIARAKKLKDKLIILESASGQRSSKVSAIEGESSKSVSCNQPKHPKGCLCHLQQVSKKSSFATKGNKTTEQESGVQNSLIPKMVVLQSDEKTRQLKVPTNLQPLANITHSHLTGYVCPVCQLSSTRITDKTLFAITKFGHLLCYECAARLHFTSPKSSEEGIDCPTCGKPSEKIFITEGKFSSPEKAHQYSQVVWTVLAKLTPVPCFANFIYFMCICFLLFLFFRFFLST